MNYSTIVRKIVRSHSTIVMSYSTVVRNYSTILKKYSTLVMNYTTIVRNHSTIVRNYSTIVRYYSNHCIVGTPLIALVFLHVIRVACLLIGHPSACSFVFPQRAVSE